MVFQGFFSTDLIQRLLPISPIFCDPNTYFFIPKRYQGLSIILVDHYLHHEEIGDTDEKINSIQNVKFFKSKPHGETLPPMI